MSCFIYTVQSHFYNPVSVQYTDCDDIVHLISLPANESISICAKRVTSKQSEVISIIKGELCDTCVTCPEGYEANGDECIKTTTFPAEYSGGLLPIVTGSKNSAYNKFGIKLYPDISGYTLPLYAFGPQSTWAVYENDGLGPIVVPTHSLQSNLWGCDIVSNPTCGTGLVGGRLNITGIWSTGYPNNTDLPLDFCIDVTEEKQYLIGISGDNKVKIEIDSIPHVFLDTTGTAYGTESGATRPFNHWHVFPITLSPGSHTIRLIGYNIDSDAAFGAEIYDINLTTFISTLLNPAVSTPNCGNIANDIEPYIIFSTRDYIGKSIPDPDLPGTWSCNDGYTIDYCQGIPICTIVETASFIPCCWRLTNCITGEVYHTTVDLSLYQDKVISLGIGVCYYVTVSSMEECIDPIDSLDIIDNYETCLDCAPYYALRDCETGDISTLINDDPAIFKYTDGSIDPLTLLNVNIIQINNDETNNPIWIGCGYFEVLNYIPDDFVLLSTIDAPTTIDKNEDPVYKLIDCTDEENFLYASNVDLATVAGDGSVVSLIDHTECWTVEIHTGCCATLTEIEVDTCFSDCEACLPLIPPIRVHTPKIIDPGYVTNECDPEKVEEVKCSFAGVMYNKMMSERFKIENCCPEDDEKWIIENEILNLNLITSSTICETIILLDVLCLSLVIGSDPAITVTLTPDVTNTFYLFVFGPDDISARLLYNPLFCRWEFLKTEDDEEILYHTIDTNDTSPVGTWTIDSSITDDSIVTTSIGSCT